MQTLGVTGELGAALLGARDNEGRSILHPIYTDDDAGTLAAIEALANRTGVHPDVLDALRAAP